jgi:hypothetical protein
LISSFGSAITLPHFSTFSGSYWNQSFNFVLYARQFDENCTKDLRKKSIHNKLVEREVDVFMTEIDEVIRKRLIYVKSLYMHGHQHIPYGTEFDRMIAIHHFDNAVELILKCVATQYGISFKHPLTVIFPTLWDNVNEKYEQDQNSELPKKTEMFQLHNIRSDVQHWGISPFSLEISSRFDVYTLDFIQMLLDSVFGLKYNELFVSSLINDEEIRKFLTEAEKDLGDEKWKDVVHKVSLAFALAKLKTENKLNIFSPFHELSSLSFTNLREFREIKDGFEKLTDAVKVLALNIDYEKYTKFEENTPAVFLPYQGEPQIQETRDLNYTRENALFCFDFVLDSILKWRI